jgi:hypothetical protein
VITWAIAHNQLIGAGVAGFIAGVMFAAWRQSRLEDGRWVRRMRSNVAEADRTARLYVPAEWDSFPMNDS